MWLRIAMFISLYLLIYSVFHVVVYFAFRPLWRPLKWPKKLFRFISSIMIILPVASLLLERYGFADVAAPLAQTGYVWMGFILIALAVSVGVWVLQGLAALFRRRPKRGGGRVWALLALLITLSAMYYGYNQASNPKVLFYKVASPKIQAGEARIRVAQISDLHLGINSRMESLKNLVLRLKDLRPDIIVSTGDLVDGYVDPIGLKVQMLAELKPRWGKFAVPGNHEYIASYESTLKVHESMGFQMLRDEALKVKDMINLVGVDDPHNGPPPNSEAELLRSVQNGRFTFLLKHRPDLGPESEGLFDLQLSGHTHGGQIFPYSYLVSLVYTRMAGIHSLAKGGVIYTSRGTGTWGPPFRVLAQPEIAVFDLQPGPSFSIIRMP